MLAESRGWKSAHLGGWEGADWRANWKKGRLQETGACFFYRGLRVREIMPSVVSRGGKGSPKREEWMGK